MSAYYDCTLQVTLCIRSIDATIEKRDAERFIKNVLDNYIPEGETQSDFVNDGNWSITHKEAENKGWIYIDVEAENLRFDPSYDVDADTRLQEYGDRLKLELVKEYGVMLDVSKSYLTMYGDWSDNPSDLYAAISFSEDEEDEDGI